MYLQDLKKKWYDIKFNFHTEHPIQYTQYKIWTQCNGPCSIANNEFRGTIIFSQGLV